MQSIHTDVVTLPDQYQIQFWTNEIDLSKQTVSSFLSSLYLFFFFLWITARTHFVINLLDSLPEELIRTLAFDLPLEKMICSVFISVTQTSSGLLELDFAWRILFLLKNIYIASFHPRIHSHSSFIKSQWLSMCISSQWTRSCFGCFTLNSLKLGSKPFFCIRSCCWTNFIRQVSRTCLKSLKHCNDAGFLLFLIHE